MNQAAEISIAYAVVVVVLILAVAVGIIIYAYYDQRRWRKNLRPGTECLHLLGPKSKRVFVVGIYNHSVQITESWFTPKYEWVPKSELYPINPFKRD